MICPICFNKNDFIDLSPKYCQTNNIICKECGLVFIPRDTSTHMQDYYKDDGYFKRSPNLSLRKELMSPSMLIIQAKKRIKIIEEMHSDMRFNDNKILDVGCSYGEILYVLKQDYNAEVVGLEPSPETAEIGRNLFGVKIHTKILEEYNSKEKFDVILCSHTLEHVDDPKAFVSDLAKLLNPEGYLYIEIPNILKPTGGFRLDKFLYNEHLQTFSAYNLNLLFQNLGLTTHNYSDKDFLRFIVQKETNNACPKPEPISYKDIISFLDNYKTNYSIRQNINVYKSKFIYLLQLIYLKVFKDGKYTLKN